MAAERMTLVEIRDRIEADLSIAVVQSLDAETLEAQASRCEVVRGLAGALIDVDQVCMARGIRANVPPPVGTIEELTALVWNESQEAGCTTAIADELVRRLARALGHDDAVVAWR